MATMLKIVERAFRKIAISGVGEALEADSIAEGLDALNMMLHAWKLRGVDIQHDTLEATDDFPLEPEFEEGTVYLLAERLNPNYSSPPRFDANDWFRGFQAVYAKSRTVTIPSGLRNMPSQRRRYI